MIIFAISREATHTTTSIRAHLLGITPYSNIFLLYYSFSGVFLVGNFLSYLLNIDHIQTRYYGEFVNLRCGSICLIDLRQVLVFSEGFYPTYDLIMAFIVFFFTMLSVGYFLITFIKLSKVHIGKALLSASFILLITLSITFFISISSFTNFKEILDGTIRQGQPGAILAILLNFSFFTLYYLLIIGLYYGLKAGMEFRF